jgi:hypothetical protein
MGTYVRCVEHGSNVFPGEGLADGEWYEYHLLLCSGLCQYHIIRGQAPSADTFGCSGGDQRSMLEALV